MKAWKPSRDAGSEVMTLLRWFIAQLSNHADGSGEEKKPSKLEKLWHDGATNLEPWPWESNDRFNLKASFKT